MSHSVYLVVCLSAYCHLYSMDASLIEPEQGTDLSMSVKKCHKENIYHNLCLFHFVVAIVVVLSNSIWSLGYQVSDYWSLK